MNAVSSDFVPIPARERPVVFQLAGGSRDHYTSRAKFILLVTASPLFECHSADSTMVWAAVTIGRG